MGSRADISGKEGSDIEGPNKEAGFSVLEALVAMAILAGALLPLLALQGQFIRSVAQMDAVEERLSVQALLAAKIASTNLSDISEGSFDVEDVTVNWSAAPLVAPRPVKNQGGQRSRFNVTYYSVTAILVQPTGQRTSMDMRGLGWEATRSVLQNL